MTGAYEEELLQRSVTIESKYFRLIEPIMNQLLFNTNKYIDIITVHVSTDDRQLSLFSTHLSVYVSP